MGGDNFQVDVYLDGSAFIAPYNNVLASPHTVAGLVTMGTPNWGYPFENVDVLANCPQLVQDMAGSWSLPTGNPDNRSSFLQSINTTWNNASYGGYWLAAGGTFCSQNGRKDPLNLTGPANTGCLEPNGTYANDGVVCADSALYSSNPAGAPTLTYNDPPHNYAHTLALGGWGTVGVMGCFASGKNSLNFPPPGDPLYTQLVTVINGQ
jgi:hypothetical protein